MGKHVKQNYLDWAEGRLSPAQRGKIAGHLKHCRECQTYFQRLDNLFKAPPAAPLPELESDPFLPQRIKALASQAREKPTDPSPGRLALLSGWQMVFSAALLFLAISLGVFLGKGLSPVYQVSDEEIVQYYSEVFAPEEVDAYWQNLVPEDEGRQQ